MTKRLRSLSVLTLASLAAGTASAIDAGGIAIHGSISATGAYSGDYDYYGDTSDSVDLNVKEITLNGTYRFESGLRAAAQLYAYDLAGYNDLLLDFATLDYSFNELVGLRAGRNKLPQGFYGEAQDLDQIRTFASLPLNFYPRALRSTSAGYNGAALYGTAQLAKAGSLEYQAFFGWMDNDDPKSLFSQGITDLSAADSVNLDQIYGGALIWNAPVDGLKFGFTYNMLPEIEVVGRVQTRAGLVATGSSFAPIAGMIDAGFGAGAWDFSGLFAGSRASTVVDVAVKVASAEYSRDKWVFSAEYKAMESDVIVNIDASPPLRVVNNHASNSEEHWYAQVTYQATEVLGLGVYYAQSDLDPDSKDARDDKFTSVDDIAVGASYALTDNWLIKVEAHALDGLGNLSLAGDRNLGATDPKWNYFIVKTTFSF